MKLNDQSQKRLQSSKELINEVLNEGIDISFENIYYSVDVIDQQIKNSIPCKKIYKKKQILKGINGIFKAGSMTAIMGVSGGGKTTLLNILTCRIKLQNGGKLFANNFQYEYQTFGSFANYVTQNDILMQSLTVRQTLQFTARLKLNQSEQDIKQRVKELANEMKLQKCLDTLIGGVFLKGISGGQRKRTSIVCELISNNQVIFLDEPTSGLDSLTSYIICSKLRKLTRSQNKTVIMTIHQPNKETYELFDQLILLVQGQIMYHKDACNIKSYFQSNFGLVCTQHMNPSDFFMMQIHHHSQQNIRRFQQYFSCYQKYQKKNIQQRISMKLTNSFKLNETNVGFLTSLKTLTHRNLINLWRNPALLRGRIIKYILTVLFMGGLFFGIGSKDYTVHSNWVQINGFLFFLTFYCLTFTIFTVTLHFPLERQIVLRQQDSRLYTVWQYFLSRNIVEIPQFILVPTIYILIYYFMIDLSNSISQFFMHCLIMFLISFSGSSLGLFIGSIIIDPKSVTGVVPFFVLPIIMFSGYLKNRHEYPVWIGWIEYLSPCKYGYLALVENQVEFKDSNVKDLNFDITKWQAVILLFCLGLAFRILSYFFLYFMKKRNH